MVRRRQVSRGVVLACAVGLVAVAAGCSSSRPAAGGASPGGSGTPTQTSAASAGSAATCTPMPPGSPGGASTAPVAAAGPPLDNGASMQPSEITPAWMHAATASWQPVAWSPVMFAPAFLGLSYGNPYYDDGYDEQVLTEELTMLEESGANAISVHLGYEPWLKGNTAAIALDDRMIAKIRAGGCILVLEDASSESYRHAPLPWPQFETAWVARVRALAERYHPQYYVVVKEPGWYLPMIQGAGKWDRDPSVIAGLRNPATWRTLVAQLVDAVHAVSPSTVVGVSVPSSTITRDSGAFLDAVRALPGLGFLGFDIYDETGFDQAQAYIAGLGPHHLPVFLAEAWNGPTPTPSPADQASMGQWAQALYRFALYVHATEVSPFFTDEMASYAPRPSTTAGLLAYYRNRTAVFTALQGVAAAKSAHRTPVG